MKKVSNALSVFALALVLSVGAFASVAHAQEWGDSYSYDGGGFGDSYSYDGGSGWGDSYSYDGGSGWGDSYSYDGGNAWGDSYSTDGGYGDLYSYDGSNSGGNLYSYDGGGNLYSYDGGGNLYTADGGNLYTYDGGNLYTLDNGGNLYTAEDQNGYYVDEYMDEYAQEYAQQNGGSYGGGSFGGGSFGGGSSMGGFSIPSFGSTGGCTSCHSQTPIPTPTCTRNCYPTPAPVCPAGTTGTYPNCHTIPVPTCTTCGGSNTTNINTNTNTYVDNSINGSFNTNISNSGNTTILAPVVPQQQVVYQQNAAPYCVISLTNAGSYNAQATLVWSSSNATSAYISQVGSVAPNGQRYVTGYANQTYSLTVSGQGGTYTCQTQPFTPTYVPQAPITPSVSLTQIPYTGLALSPFAAAMYWLSLLSVAAAGGYLLVYYKGGALAFAGASLSRRQNHFVVSEQEAEEIEAPVTTEVVEEEVATPIANVLNFLPAMAESKTRDAMQMIRNANGMPQIVINRA